MASIGTIDIEIPTGSTSDKVGQYALMAIQATSERGLNSIVSTALGTVNKYVESYTDPTAVSNMITDEINKLMQESGAMDKLLESMDAANDIILLMKKALNIVIYASGIAANVTDICGTKGDGICVPSVKECTKRYTLSIKKQLAAAYNDVKQMGLDMYNSLICTSCDSTVDNVMNSINNILDLIEPYIDPYIQQYTGYTVAEIRALCNQGFAYVKMLLRITQDKAKGVEHKSREQRKAERAAKKKAKEEAEAAKEEFNMLDSSIVSKAADSAKAMATATANEAKDAAIGAYNSAKDQAVQTYNDAKDQAVKTANEVKEAGKASIDELKQLSDDALAQLCEDFSEEEVKEKLMDWLSNQSIMLQNAFHFLIIKDMITDIKLNCEKLGNASIENFADFVNALNAVFDIFDALGITPDAKGITVDDLINLGIGTVGMANSAVKSVAANAEGIYNQAKDQVGSIKNSAVTAATGVANQATSAATNIASSTTNAATSTVSNLLNSANEQLESMKSSASNMQSQMQSVLNDGVQTAQDQAMAAGTAAQQAGQAVMGNLTTSVTNGLSGVASKISANNDTGNEFIVIGDITTGDDPTEIIVEVTVIDDINKTELKDLLDEKFNISNKAIFSNAVKNTIINKIKKAWTNEKESTFSVQTKVLKVTRKYTFNVTVDTTSKKEIEKAERESLLTQLAQSIKSVGASAATSIVNNVADAAGQTANNAYSAASSMVTAGVQSSLALASSATGQMTSLVSNTQQMVTGSAAGIATGAINSTKSVVTDAIGGAQQLTGALSGIAPTLDLTYVDAILKDKVMMFDVVIQFIKVLLPVIEILTFLCHLLENYYTNKDFVKNKSNVAINKAIRDCAQLYEGLKDFIDNHGCNTYTVRTKELEDWCKANLEMEILDEAGTAKISIADTIKFNAHIVVTNIDYWHGGTEQVVSTLMPTILIFDRKGIESGDKIDGTLDGLDNIRITDEGIYYDAKQRSTMASQILRAINNKEEAEVSKTPEIETAKDDITSFLDAITFESDDYEGLQAIDIQEMNLCSPEQLYSTDTAPDSSANVAIIEFGDEYTMGDAIDFVWAVNPGDSLTEDTVIAYVTKNGNQQEVKSHFTKGTIKTIDDEFFHYYPGSSNRHIVIENYEEGLGCKYDFNDVSVLASKFKLSSEIATLIINNMCYSGLPKVLSKCKRVTGKDDVIKTYSDFVTDYEDTVKQYAELIEAASKPKDKEGEHSTNTISSLNAQSDKLLALRKLLINDIIEMYNTRLPNDAIKSRSSLYYTDCGMLAYGDNNDIQNFKIGEDVYENYYVNLLANVDIQSDTEWNNKYYELLSDIINKRNSLENHNYGSAVAEFNRIFNSAINSNVLNPFLQIWDVFKGKDVKYKDIKEYIKNIYVYSNSDNSSKLLLTNAKDEDEKKNWYSTQALKLEDSDEHKNMANICKLLANIYVFVLTQLPEKFNTTTLTSETVISTTNNTLTRNLFAEAEKTYISLYHDYVNSTEADPIGKSKEVYHAICSKFHSQLARVLAFRIFLSGYTNYLNDMDEDALSEDTAEGESDLYLTATVSSNMYQIIKYLVKHETQEDPYLNEVTKTYVENYQLFLLVKEEEEKLNSFWQEVIEKYTTEFEMDKLVQDVKDYTASLTADVEWPTPIDLDINGKHCKLYEFADHYEEPKEDISDMIIEDPGDFIEPSREVSTNPEDTKDINDPTKSYTILDYEYWLLYFASATLVSAVPAYWGDGFDVPSPSGLTPTLMPGIYVPIYKPVMIKPLNLLLVFGIGIRGIWPWPILLMINCSSDDINAMTPIMLALNTTKSLFLQGMDFLEQGIPNIINGLINNLTESNMQLKKQYEKYKVWAELIKSIPMEDKALIEKEFRDALYGDDYDRRQVITRVEKLGQGPDPM